MNVTRCYCCGKRAGDLRPQGSKFGVCFRCGMAGAILGRKQTCRTCRAKRRPWGAA